MICSYPCLTLNKLETSKPLRLQPARPPPAQAQAQPLETHAQLMPRPPNNPLPPPVRLGMLPPPPPPPPPEPATRLRPASRRRADSLPKIHPRDSFWPALPINRGYHDQRRPGPRSGACTRKCRWTGITLELQPVPKEPSHPNLPDALETAVGGAGPCVAGAEEPRQAGLSRVEIGEGRFIIDDRNRVFLTRLQSQTPRPPGCQFEWPVLGPEISIGLRSDGRCQVTCKWSTGTSLNQPGVN